MTDRLFNAHRIPTPAMPLIAPLIGLAYIVSLPFVGLFTLISLTGWRAKQGVYALRHRTVHATIDAW